MRQVTIDIPEEALTALEIAPESVASEIRMVAAVKLYEMRRLSSGAAACLAGIPRALFLTKLGEYGVSTFNLTEDELCRDLENA